MIGQLHPVIDYCSTYGFGNSRGARLVGEWIIHCHSTLTLEYTQLLKRISNNGHLACSPTSSPLGDVGRIRSRLLRVRLETQLLGQCLTSSSTRHHSHARQLSCPSPRIHPLTRIAHAGSLARNSDRCSLHWHGPRSGGVVPVLPPPLVLSYAISSCSLSRDLNYYYHHPTTTNITTTLDTPSNAL